MPRAAAAGGLDALPSMRSFEGRAALLMALFATAFLKTAHAWAAERMGRRLSLVSLLLFPLLNSVFEGCLLLGVFDLGR